jgi:hypothetical protein
VSDGVLLVGGCCISQLKRGPSEAASRTSFWGRTLEKKLKHLEFIQGVINRLSNNSFSVKGWSVVLVSALFALSAKDANVAFVYLAYLPASVFWGLDGYFLRLERAYRRLYDTVRTTTEEKIDFCMDARDINKNVFAAWTDATFSKTLVPFHCALILSVLVVMLVEL